MRDTSSAGLPPACMDRRYADLIGKAIADVAHAGTHDGEDTPAGEALILTFTDHTVLRVDTTANVAALVGAGYETPGGQRLKASDIWLRLQPTWWEPSAEGDR